MRKSATVKIKEVYTVTREQDILKNNLQSCLDLFLDATVEEVEDRLYDGSIDQQSISAEFHVFDRKTGEWNKYVTKH